LLIEVNVSAIKNKPGFYDVVHEAKTVPTIIFEPIASSKALEIYIEKMRELGYLDDLSIVCPKGLNVDKTLDVAFADYSSQAAFIRILVKKSNKTLMLDINIVFPTSRDWQPLSGLLEDPRVHASSPTILETDGQSTIQELFTLT
jgi:hypothetical protein